jgi:hypothetical protein
MAAAFPHVPKTPFVVAGFATPELTVFHCHFAEARVKRAVTQWCFISDQYVNLSVDTYSDDPPAHLHNPHRRSQTNKNSDPIGSLTNRFSQAKY